MIEYNKVEANDRIRHLIGDVVKECSDSGTLLLFWPESHVNYLGVPSSGYFVEKDVMYNKPTLAVATQKPIRDWISILIHESCHHDQWREKSPLWDENIKSFEVEACDVFFDSIFHGKEIPKDRLVQSGEICLRIERDAERRSIEKIKRYHLLNLFDLVEYTQKSNAYFLAYRFAIETGVFVSDTYIKDDIWMNAPKELYFGDGIPYDLKVAFERNM